jgi:hypothetical protein
MKKNELKNPKKQELLNLFTQKFKGLGFLKTKQTWKKITKELTFVCNVQSSQWDNEDYYVNVGILVNKLSHFPHLTYGNVETRIDLSGTAEDVHKRVVEWFDKYNTLIKLVAGCKRKDFPEIMCNAILVKLSEE